MAEVRLDGITKTFGDTTAVDDLSLTIANGEFVVLLGPTGAGKTTTLRLIAGLEKPDAGTLWINGVDMTRAQPAERDVSFVFQQYSLYPHYTVFQNLAFPLKSPVQNWSKADIDARVHEIARMLHIEEKLGNRATKLSGGEMQRVAIGRALVRRPALFLMDEPLSSLDAKLRAELRVELKRISIELGATILYVTHDQIEAMTMADRIGVLHTGRLEQLGPPREVYTAPANEYVAQRLGSPQINLVDPTIFLPTPPAGTARLGIRPEDVDLTGTDGVPGHVTIVEHLGPEAVATVQVNGAEMRALVDPHAPVNAGSAVTVAVDPQRMLHFDAAGWRVTPPANAIPPAPVPDPLQKRPAMAAGPQH